MYAALNAMQVRAAKSGVGQYIAGLLEGLSAADPQARFRVYCSPDNRANYALPAPNVEAVAWGLPEGWREVRLANEYLRFPAEAARSGCDLLVGLSNFLPVRKVLPHVVNIYDLSYFVHPERCPWLRRKYWHAMTRSTVRVADRIITCSEHSRGDIARFFPAAAARTVVVYPGVHPRYRPSGRARGETAVARRGVDRPYVLYVGTLEPGKNVARLINAFDSVAGEFPEHQLVIVGDRGWLFEGIFEAAERAAHRDRILFLGHLGDDEVVEFMNHCEFLAFPSLYEGFGLPPLEAMACGAPVLVSDTSSLPEVVGDAAVLVNPLDGGAIAQGLRRLLADPGLRTELRARGLERAATFSWDRAARETLQVYRSVIG